VKLEHVLGDIDAECLDSHRSSPSSCALSACRAEGRAVHPIRWKKQYSGLESTQVRELKQLSEDNARLKKLVADLSLDKAVLQDVLSKKFPGQRS
jgi:hypothetical protein